MKMKIVYLRNDILEIYEKNFSSPSQMALKMLDLYICYSPTVGHVSS